MRGGVRIVSWVLVGVVGATGVAGAAEAKPAAKGTKAESAKPPEKAPETFAALKFRSIGPATGGRVSRVAGVPGDPRIFYAATAQGGVWKSEDGGHKFQPIFDDQPIASIGSIAVAPSDPNVVYVGSGEANIRGNVAPGNGIYKSTDAGKSWTQVWKQVGQIGTLIVDPRDPDVAFAAVLGHAFGPNPERGVYRTRDGGATWQAVLQKDADTGASDVAFDPSNPRIVFAGLWQARRRPWELTSGGPGSGLWRSSDGGDSWTELEGHGLPEGDWGKVGVGVARSNGQRVYALIEAEAGGLFRSDDGGASWRRISGHHALRQRAWYYSTLTIDPTNPDVVWFPQVPMLKTIDGGKTVTIVSGIHHGDHHDLWIDPADPRRMISANDGGVDLSVDGGKSWWAPPLPIVQFYNVDADRREPYHVGGTMQDLGTVSGPSHSLSSEGIALADWRYAGGGEAADFVYDLDEPGVVFAGEYGGILTAFDPATGEAPNVSIYPTNPSGHGAEDLRVRFQWTAPLAVSPHDPRELYHGANVLFRSLDHGQTWNAISPDLTRDDKSKQKWSGGPITGDNTTVEIYDTIFSIAVSPIERGLLWVGSDDGLVHVTRDGGASWQKVTPPGTPEWGTVEAIEASRFAAGTAWVVVDNHRMDDYRPYLFRTTDYGKSWSALAGGLPQDVHLHVLREDEIDPKLLFLGGERGLHVSRDGGATFEALRSNLPTVAVTDLVVRGSDLVVGTRGRSLWILDDFSPLRSLTAAVRAESLALLPVTPARRWRTGYRWSGKVGTFPNPPGGATISYWLKEKVEGPLTLEIRDSDGRLVRTLSSVAEPAEYPEDDPDEPQSPPEPDLSTDAGLHRVVWEFDWTGARRLDRAKVDTGNPRHGPEALPGRYSLRLRHAGTDVAGSVEVLPDPRSRVSRADLEAQLAFSLEIRDAIDEVIGAIERVRAIRRQASALGESLAGRLDATAVADLAKRLVERTDALEAKLHNPKAEVVYDILAQRGGVQLYSNLAFVYETARQGEIAPTQGAREVFAEQRLQQEKLAGELAEIERGLVADLDAKARALGLPRIVLPAASR